MFNRFLGEAKVWGKRAVLALVGAVVAGGYAYVLWLQHDNAQLETQRDHLTVQVQQSSQRIEELQAESVLLKGQPLR